MSYEMSRDYGELFEMIRIGKTIAAFVDFRFDRNISEKPMRDICKIQRFNPYEITIGVRGMTYGSVDPFNEDDGAELDLFRVQCKRLNLEWISLNET